MSKYENTTQKTPVYRISEQLNQFFIKLYGNDSLELKQYTNIMIEEWINRGYNNTMSLYEINTDKYEYPPWLGNEAFHSSHRANLLRKDYQYYSQFEWSENPENPYVWLNNEGKWYAVK